MIRETATRRAVALLAAVTLHASPSFAQTKGDEAGAGAGAARAGGAIALHVELEGSGLSIPRVRAGIERELGRPVSDDPAGDKRLSVKLEAGRRVRVTFHSPKGDVSRVVDLPQDPDRATEVIALLAGNVARNEAEELLAELLARKPEETASPADGAPPPPAAADPQAPAPAAPPGQAPPAPKKASAVAAKKEARGATRKKEPPLLRKAFTANLSLYHPIALYRDSERRVVNLELAAAYGRSGAGEGVLVGLGVERVNRSLHGVLIAGIWARVDGPVSGVQSSVVMSSGKDVVRGVEMAGALAYRPSVVKGAQVAAAVAIAREVEGAQLAGLSVARDVDGGQGAATVAIARDVEGVQIAALGVARDVDGAQASATTSIARNVSGLQLGVVNIGARVDGLQLGIVNVSDELHGAALGLVNVAGDGRVSALGWSSTASVVNAGAAFEAGFLRTVVGAGFSPSGEAIRIELGLGPRFRVGRRFQILPGVYSASTQSGKSFKNEAQEVVYRGLVGFDLGRHFGVFGGGGVRQGVSGKTGVDSVKAEAQAGVSVF